jgi:hypothetical protein
MQTSKMSSAFVSNGSRVVMKKTGTKTFKKTVPAKTAPKKAAPKPAGGQCGKRTRL